MIIMNQERRIENTVALRQGGGRFEAVDSRLYETFRQIKPPGEIGRVWYDF